MAPHSAIIPRFEMLDQAALAALIDRALAEDVGQGDITTAATVRAGQRGQAKIVAKQASVVFCGGPVLEAVFQRCGAQARKVWLAAEGSMLNAGDAAATLEGELAGLLIGERTALNFIQLMSGIASLAHRYTDAVAGTRARIVDTRKTHPGLRAVEKYAVRVGGAYNHRYGLDSGVLIKDNHIAAAGSIRSAITAARRLAPHLLRIEVECETLLQVEEALASRADAIMLDNMLVEEMRRACAIIAGRATIEASGNVTLASVRQIAELGVDLISVGELTHSPPAADLSMRIEALP